MPIGEDLPALIPISVAIAILVIGLTGLYVNYVQKTEANSLHRAGLNVAERFAYQGNGLISAASLDCSHLNASSAGYDFRINVSDLENGQSTACGRELNYSVTVSVPVLILQPNGTTDAGKVYVQVMRK
jgi:hypothetical protein